MLDKVQGQTERAKTNHLNEALKLDVRAMNANHSRVLSEAAIF